MLKPEHYLDVGDMFTELVPTYKGRGWRPFAVSFGWNSDVVDFMRQCSTTRCDRRIASYMIPGELERSKGSIRFGHVKTGRGYKEQRGDYCLIGGSYEKGHLSVFYRRLEMIGGLHYDLAVFAEIDKVMPLRRITIFAAEAKVFALRGNSNEKLYNKLMDYYP